MLSIARKLIPANSDKLGSDGFIKRRATSFAEFSEGAFSREQLIKWLNEYANDVQLTVPKEFHAEINEIIDGNNLNKKDRDSMLQDTIIYNGSWIRLQRCKDEDIPAKMLVFKPLERERTILPVQLPDTSREGVLELPKFRIASKYGTDQILEFVDAGWRIRFDEKPKLALLSGKRPKKWLGPEMRFWARDFEDYAVVTTLTRNDFAQKRIDVYRLYDYPSEDFQIEQLHKHRLPSL